MYPSCDNLFGLSDCEQQQFLYESYVFSSADAFWLVNMLLSGQIVIDQKVAGIHKDYSAS